MAGDQMSEGLGVVALVLKETVIMQRIPNSVMSILCVMDNVDIKTYMYEVAQFHNLSYNS